MAQIKVLSLQSFLDISTQYTGNVYNAYAIATANNRAVTDELINGELLIIPDSLTLSKKVLEYYGARTILPATALTTPPPNSQSEGIGSMIIETTFIVR